MVTSFNRPLVFSIWKVRVFRLFAKLSLYLATLRIHARFRVTPSQVQTRFVTAILTFGRLGLQMF